MEILIGIVIGILAGGIMAFLLTKKRFSSKLALSEQNAGELSAKLAEANEDKKSLNGQLDDNKREIASLNDQLEESKQEVTDRTKSNENALRLVHLFKLSLQITAVAFHCKQVHAERLVKHSKDLAKKYKKLVGQYKELHGQFRDAADDYRNFCEEVERKAKQRLVRSGVGAVLSLIPGVGLVQVANDLIELLSSVGEAAEDIEELNSAIGSLPSFGNVIGVVADLVPVVDFALALKELQSDQDSSEMQDYQSAVKETFEHNLGPDIKMPDISAVNAFMKDIIERMRDIVDSRPQGERQDAIAQIVNNFNQFGITSYNDGRDPKSTCDWEFT